MFYQARFGAEYAPIIADEEEDAIPSSFVLVRPKDLLLSPPEKTWEHVTNQHNLIGRAWGVDLPAGNARLNFSFEVCIRSRKLAGLEYRLHEIETELNLNRLGILTYTAAYTDWDPLMGEARYQGTPLIAVRYDCTVSSATARILSSEEAPPLPGAWGVLKAEMILTNPHTN